MFGFCEVQNNQSNNFSTKCMLPHLDYSVYHKNLIQYCLLSPIFMF